MRVKHKRKYRITNVGYERFHTLMMDTAPPPREYEQMFLQKVLVLRFLRHRTSCFLNSRNYSGGLSTSGTSRGVL